MLTPSRGLSPALSLPPSTCPRLLGQSDLQSRSEVLSLVRSPSWDPRLTSTSGCPLAWVMPWQGNSSGPLRAGKGSFFVVTHSRADSIPLHPLPEKLPAPALHLPRPVFPPGAGDLSSLDPEPSTGPDRSQSWLLDNPRPPLQPRPLGQEEGGLAMLQQGLQCWAAPCGATPTLAGGLPAQTAVALLTARQTKPF